VGCTSWCLSQFTSLEPQVGLIHERDVMRPPAERPLEDPQAELETALIDEFLRMRGVNRQTVREIPEEKATALMREALAYASARLTELESRAHYVNEIHGTAGKH
jgi:hypothetical protein